jgi:hypothetical protein
MVKHIDLFEKLCGQMAHNRPLQPPSEEQKIDWFLDTVHERTYESVHATCVDQHIEGILTFAKLVKMYIHKCFQKYPQFQISEIDPKAASQLQNNANHLHKGGRKGKGNKGQNNRGNRHGDRNGQQPTTHRPHDPNRPGKGSIIRKGERKDQEPRRQKTQH